MVEDSQRDRRFPNPSYTNESDWNEVLCQANDLLDQVITSETGPWRRGRGLSRHTRFKCKTLDPLVVRPLVQFESATHLAIGNSGSDIIHELRHGLGILAPSHITHTLDMAGHVSELAFDLFQDAVKGSAENWVKGCRNI